MSMTKDACASLGLSSVQLDKLAKLGWMVFYRRDGNYELRNEDRGEPALVAHRFTPNSAFVGNGTDALLLDLHGHHHLGDGRDVPVVKHPIKPQTGRDVFKPQFGCEASDYYPRTPQDLAAYSLQLPKNPATRKKAPMAVGLLDYFPDACYDVARLSYIGNEQHNPGEPVHWARGKGGNNRDEIIRHTLQSRELDPDPITGKKVLHATKVAWRALAEAQLAIEEYRSKGNVYPPEEE